MSPLARPASLSRPTAPDRERGRREEPRRPLILLLAAALAINLGLLWLYHTPAAKELSGDEVYYFRTATAIAGGQEVRHNPFWPPLYAELLGRVLAVLGVRVLSVQIFQIGLWLVAAVLFHRLVSRLSPSPAATWTATVLFLVSPELSACSHYLWPEIPHLALFFAGLACLVFRPESRLSAAAGGAFFGLALLTKSLLRYFIPVVLVVYVLEMSDLSRGKRLGRAGLVVLLTFLTVMPTLLANHREHGRWMIADSVVFNAWVGLIETETVDYEAGIAGRESRRFQRSAPDFETRNTIYREKIRRRLTRQGVLATVRGQLCKQYFRLFDHETLFTTQLPGGPRAAYTFDLPWLTRLLHLWSHVVHAVILATAALGVCCVRRRPFGWVHALLLFIVYNLGIFFLLHVRTRFLVQFLPMMIFFSGVAVSGLVRRWRGETPFPPESPFAGSTPRLAAGIALAVLLELLAFRSLAGS